MAHTVQLNWGKPLNHTLPSLPMSQDGFCQIVCHYSYVTPFFNLLYFRPKNEVSGPLRPEAPELGVVITTLQWLNVSSSWELDLVPAYYTRHTYHKDKWSMRIVWLILSKAADKLSKVSAVTLPLSIFKVISLCTFRRAVSVEWSRLYADWNTFDRLFEYEIQGVLLQPFQVSWKWSWY